MLIKMGEIMSETEEFNTLAFEKKLMQLKDTQESIQSLSSWCLKQREHHKKIVASWLNVLKRVKVEQRLTLFYLANDVIQYSKRKNYDFVESWGLYLQKATPLVRDEKVRPKILRILKIWEQRGVYDDEFLSDLTGLLSSGVLKKADDDPLDFQPQQLVNKIRQCTDLESDTDLRLKNIHANVLPLNDPDLLSTSLKDRSNKDDVEKELNEGIQCVERYTQALQREIVAREALLALLATANQYYSTQRGEVKVVAYAYKNFGSRVRSLKRKLDSLAPTLPPAVSPPREEDVPSPGPDEDLDLPNSTSASGNDDQLAYNIDRTFNTSLSADGSLYNLGLTSFLSTDNPLALFNDCNDNSNKIEVINSRPNDKQDFDINSFLKTLIPNENNNSQDNSGANSESSEQRLPGLDMVPPPSFYGTRGPSTELETLACETNDLLPELDVMQPSFYGAIPTIGPEMDTNNISMPSLDTMPPPPSFYGAGDEPEPYRPEPEPYCPEDVFRTKPEPYRPEPELYRNQPEPYRPEQKPYRPESEPYRPESEPYRPESEPYRPESEPYTPVSEPYIPVSEPYRPETEPYRPKSEPYRPESEPYRPESEPYRPESEPYRPESEPYRPDQPTSQWTSAGWSLPRLDTPESPPPMPPAPLPPVPLVPLVASVPYPVSEEPSVGNSDVDHRGLLPPPPPPPSLPLLTGIEDVDHRLLPVITPVPPPPRPAALDVDHRNLISLTNMPSIPLPVLTPTDNVDQDYRSPPLPAPTDIVESVDMDLDEDEDQRMFTNQSDSRCNNRVLVGGNGSFAYPSRERDHKQDEDCNPMDGPKDWRDRGWRPRGPGGPPHWIRGPRPPPRWPGPRIQRFW